MRWICIYIFNIFNTLFPIHAKVILLHGMKYISAATVFSGLFSKQFIESLFISPLTWSDTSKNICYVLHIDSVMSSWAFQASSLMFQFSLVQSLSCVRLFATPWIAAHQASLSITNSWSSPRLTSIESVMPSSHLILCRPLLLLPPIPPSIRVFSNESTLRMR